MRQLHTFIHTDSGRIHVSGVYRTTNDLLRSCFSCSAYIILEHVVLCMLAVLEYMEAAVCDMLFYK